MQAKIEALMQQVASGRIKTLQGRLLAMIQIKPRTVEELRDHYGIAHQTVTARLSELEDLGLITKARRVAGESYSSYHFVEDMAEQVRLRRRKEAERRQRWVDLGVRNGWIKSSNQKTLF